MGVHYKPLKIYKASAGSGKTYALAKEYVKILIRTPMAYRQTLAITFTKKATAEMKSRILWFLRVLRDGQDADLKAAIIGEIKKEHGFDVSHQLEKNAGEALSRILHDYAHFQITTIDSFFQHIIRSFAKELNLPIGMAVELDTEKVLQKCVDALMEDYENGDSKLSAWLENFAFSKMDDAKGWKIERNLLEMSKELVKEQYLELHDADADKPELENYDELLKAMKKTIRIYQDTIQQIVQQARSDIDNNSIALSFYTRDAVRSFLEKATAFTFDSIVTIQKMISGEQSPVPKTKITSDPDEAGRMTAYWEEVLKNQLAAILEHHENNNSAYQTAKHILRHLYSLALMDLLAEKLKTYREEENTMLISDANHIIGKIAGEEASPFIFEKAGTFLKYLLIDEFQDTSQMQWRGLLPMVLEIVAQGSGMSLIVGDPKQSIYRWRGGKMELLLKQIDQDFRHFKALKEEIPLNTNYRSAPEIIEFNNALFEALKSDRIKPVELFQLAYQQHEQIAQNTTLQGYVECRWLKQEKDDDDSMLPELLAILKDAGSRRNWKDICILVRRNSEGVAIANYLSTQAPEIPFVSGESLLVNSALSVKLLIAAIEYVQFSEQVFYCSKLDYLFTQYFDLAKPEEVLNDQSAYYFEKIFEAKNTNIALLQKMTIDELVPALLRLFDLDKQSDAYLLRLQDIVFDFVSDQELSVASFLEHWDEQKDKYAILPPDGMNAVTISTIHKAKGLEYPVVIIPYVDWNIAPKANSIFWGMTNDAHHAYRQAEWDKIRHFPIAYQQSLADTAFSEVYKKETELGYVDIMNVLYVAFTRPKEELYVLCKDRTSKIPEEAKYLSIILKNILQASQLKGAEFENDRFTFGKFSKVVRSAKQELPGILPSPVLNDYRAYLKLKQQEVWNEHVWQGDILHDMLAMIEWRKDVPKAVASIALKYGLSKTEIAEQIKKVEAVMRLLEEQHWLDKKYVLLNEHALYFDGEELRPDKVLMAADECIIIDYKTGATDHKHAQQLKKYKSAFASILQVPVRAYLLYTKNMQLEEI